MTRRISHSLLDPWLTNPVKKRYPALPFPRKLPPEAIVLMGHSLAIAGGVGLATATTTWWGGLVAAIGIAGNHLCDVLDGTHARATNQCRNGGELLDHFLDPLSFAYWLVGIAVSCGRLDLGLVAVIVLFATAVLTNIKAKLTGEFTLASIGPTEFKTLLVVYGLSITVSVALGAGGVISIVTMLYAVLIGFGILQLITGLFRAVSEVNRHGRPADTSEWITTSDAA